MTEYKLLLFSDFHISSKGRRSVRRLEECLRTAEWIAELINEHWPDLVANLGDTFDSHSSLDIPSLCTGVRTINIIKKAARSVAAPFILIPGNHDAYSRAYSSLEALSRRGVLIPWEPTVYDDVVGCMPYNKNEELATLWLKDLEKKAKVCLVHLDVQHAKFFSGKSYSDTGVDPNDFRGPIYAGHYHHPHTVGAFEFIGSVLHHNNTDKEFKETPRGVVIVTIEKESGQVLETKRIPNPHTAIYHTVDWTKRIKIEDILKFSKYMSRMHVRVKCHPKDVKKCKKQIEDTFNNLLSLSVIGVDKDRDVVSREVTVNVDSKPDDAVDAYVKNKGFPKGLDKKKLLETGKEFIRSASPESGN